MTPMGNKPSILCLKCRSGLLVVIRLRHKPQIMVQFTDVNFNSPERDGRGIVRVGLKAVSGC